MTEDFVSAEMGGRKDLIVLPVASNKVIGAQCLCVSYFFFAKLIL